MSEAETSLEHVPDPHAKAHPTPRKYVQIAVLLAIITAIEVAVYYIPAVGGALIPLLLFFALVKFAMVAAWFMHLRFDSRIFRRLFVTGIVLALLVFGVVLWTFFTRGGPAPGAGA